MRRGHAEDLRSAGATVAEICKVRTWVLILGAWLLFAMCQEGDWKPPSFLYYVDLKQWEMERTCEVHLEGSDSD